MINFKSIAEKCLKKDISGHFILRSGGTLHSNRLQKLGFYNFKNWEYSYNEIGECLNGKSEWDIIDFNINMNNDKRTIQVTLHQAREWYNSGNDTLRTLALSSFSKEELNPRPRSWEEYCKNNKDKQVWFIKENSDIGTWHLMYADEIISDRNTLPSKELAEAFLAMMQLMSLRQSWIGDWEAYPGAIAITRSCDNRIVAWKDPERCSRLPLSFPTLEMALDFINTFRSLLEQAKGLY